MRKQITALLAAITLLLSLAACGAKSWQEQYDLGIRYLSEGNYEEAILAFEAAIEIDPRQAALYVGRADAYIGSGDTEEMRAAALADYEKALELDETLTDAWLKRADLYIGSGDFNKAAEILKEALEKAAEPERIQEKLDELEQEHPPLNEYGVIEFTARHGFRNFDELTPEQQKIVLNVIEYGNARNMDALVAMWDSYSKLPEYGFYTQTDTYKFMYEHYTNGSHIFQFRPEAGDGYYYFLGSNGLQGYGTCPCVNWQPEGEFYQYSEQPDQNGEMVIEEATGTAVNGVIVGDVETNYATLFKTDHYNNHGQLLGPGYEGYIGVPLNIPHMTSSPEVRWW